MDVDGEQLLRQAHLTAEREARRAKPLFALLTGSVAWGATSSRSDIDIIFISAESDAVSYRYYLPELTGVATRAEVGRIPTSYLEKVLASGYADEITTGIREQIRNSKVLFGDRDLAQRTIERFAALKPRKKLLGEYLFQAREAASRAGRALDDSRLVDGFLAADLVARNIWRLVLVAAHQVGVQKDKHELKAARGHLDPASLARYEASRRISGVTAESARRALIASHIVISRVFQGAGISAGILGEVDQ